MPIDDTESFQIQVNQPAGARIQKMLTAYSSYMNPPHTEARNWAALHFDFIDMNLGHNDVVTWIKANAVNPNIKVIGYYDASFTHPDNTDWDYLNGHEAWFIHNNWPATTGTRVMNTSYSSYLMDLNAGFGNYFAQRCHDILATDTAYDGVFADDVVNGADGLYIASLSPVPPAAVYTNWPTWQHTQMQNLRNAIGSSKIIIPNLYLDQSTDIPAVTGGYYWEHFVHGRDQTHLENGHSPENILTIINEYLHPCAQAGYIITTNSGINDYNTYPTEAIRWCEFCYACLSFAVVDPNKACFSWMFYGWDNSNGYLSSPFELILGNPVDNYHLIANPYVYARNFANYYVVANLNQLGTGNVTFTLPYNNLSYILPPKQAKFIQK
jgi:hypothetical protein